MANRFALLSALGAEDFRSCQENVPNEPLRSKSTIKIDRLHGRVWTEVTPNSQYSKNIGHAKFRLASYNILAPSYAKQKFFPKCKPEYLPWSARRTALLESIEALGADILCLQEVEHFEGFWRPALRALGYRGVYKQRGGGCKPDGCATFYRESRFILVEDRGLDFDRIPDCRCCKDRGTPGFATHNVALLTLLALKCMSGDLDSAPRLAIANVHLFWDPSYEDLKLAQARAAVEATEHLSMETKGCGPAAIVLAGDFNSMPDSDVYALLADKARFTSAYAAVSLASACPFPAASTLMPDGLSATGLAAAAAAAAAAAEPAFTNFRDCFRGTIDYIFLRDGGRGGPYLRATAALGMIGEAEAAAEGGGLPSSRHPSDHLPLAVDILLLSASPPSPPERPVEAAAAATPPPEASAERAAAEDVPAEAGPACSTTSNEAAEAGLGPGSRARRRKRDGGGGGGGSGDRI